MAQAAEWPDQKRGFFSLLAETACSPIWCCVTVSCLSADDTVYPFYDNELYPLKLFKQFVLFSGDGFYRWIPAAELDHDGNFLVCYSADGIKDPTLPPSIFCSFAVKEEHDSVLTFLDLEVWEGTGVVNKLDDDNCHSSISIHICQYYSIPRTTGTSPSLESLYQRDPRSSLCFYIWN